MRAGDNRVGCFSISGGPVSCHHNDLWCHLWWRGCRFGDLLFSVLDKHDIYTEFHCDTYIAEKYMICFKIALSCLDNFSTVSL